MAPSSRLKMVEIDVGSCRVAALVQEVTQIIDRSIDSTNLDGSSSKLDRDTGGPDSVIRASPESSLEYRGHVFMYP